MAFVIDRSLYLSPEVVVEPGLRPLAFGTPKHFAAWLERQPDTKHYNFYCTDGSCLIGCYMEAHGHGDKPYWQQAQLLVGPRDHHNWTKIEYLAREWPWTFGAAKDRARKLLAEREK